MNDTDYTSLFKDTDATEADYISQIISSSVDITTNIMSVRTQKYELEARINEIREKRTQAVTEAIKKRYDEEIAYCEYVESILDELQYKLEQLQKKQQRKRIIIYGGCALIALFTIAVAYKK